MPTRVIVKIIKNGVMAGVSVVTGIDGIVLINVITQNLMKKQKRKQPLRCGLVKIGFSLLFLFLTTTANAFIFQVQNEIDTLLIYKINFLSINFQSKYRYTPKEIITAELASKSSWRVDCNCDSGFYRIKWIINEGVAISEVKTYQKTFFVGKNTNLVIIRFIKRDKIEIRRQ